MDIRELELFIHLADSLHFGKTSQRCNISPSALTRMIQRIEESVDCELFVRDKRSVVLTAEGERFLRYAEETVRNWGIMQRDLVAMRGKVAGEISLYSSVTAVYGVLPDILTQFREQYPDVHIKFETGDAAGAVQKVISGEVDFAVTALPDKMPSKLEFVRLAETSLVTIAPQGKEFPMRNGYGAIDWQQTPMILSEKGLSRSRLDQWFTAEMVIPNIYAHVSGNEAIIAMVRLGCGIGVVPSLVLEQSPFRNDVVILEDGPQLEPLSVGVCVDSSLVKSPVFNAFWETCNVSDTIKNGKIR